ncbi:MAG: hypothetical protein CME20_19640 [Gemmatimonadetes bacterium]|nr:hypothetical protein [Gemmatimonadota bacterium]
MTDSQYRLAPPGFSDEEWEIFERDGMLFFEDALDQNTIDELTAAIDRVCQSSPRFEAGQTFGCQNIVERDPAFAALIDHPRHVGYAYDLFGELLKLHQSQFFIRPPGGERYNIWHPDGARAVPYGTFSPELPLQIKIGFWLTDLPEAKMGNLVVLPGSHREQYIDEYDSHEPIDGEQVVTLKKGTMTLMHSSIWHRVEPNDSDVVRKNIFYAYCPAWLTRPTACCPTPPISRPSIASSASSCAPTTTPIPTPNLRLPTSRSSSTARPASIATPMPIATMSSCTAASAAPGPSARRRLRRFPDPLEG